MSAMSLPRTEAQARRQLRALLLEGAASPVFGPADAAYFAALRARITVAKPR